MWRRASGIAILGIVALSPSLALASAPVGTGIDVHAGSCATPEPEILVSLQATDDVGVTGYYLSESSATPVPGDFTPISSTPSFAADVPFTIVGSFGDKVVFAWFIDQENNISQPLSYELAYLDKMAVVDQVLLDGSVSSDSGVDVVTDALGNIYLAGFRFSNPFFGGGDRAFVAKYDGDTLVRDWGHSVSTSGGVGTGLTQGLDIAVDAAGNSYTVGYDLVDVQGSTSFYDAFLVKFDNAGGLGWFEPLTTDGSRNWGLGVALSPAGGIFMVGQTNGEFPGETSAGGYDAFIAKFNSGGALQWVKQFGTAGSDSARDIAIDGLGNLYVVGAASGPLFGATQLSPPGQTDIFLSKFDSAGGHLWTRLMGTDRAPESGYDVELAQGHVFVTGSAKDTCGCATMDVFLAKYTTTGGEKWTRIFGGHVFNSAEESYGMAVDALGAVYLVGNTFDDIDGNQHLGGNDLLVIKYGPTGKRLLSFTYGTADDDRGFGAAILPDGRLVVTGYAGADLLGQTALGADDLLLMTLDLGGVAIPKAITADGFETGDLSSWSASSP